MLVIHNGFHTNSGVRPDQGFFQGPSKIMGSIESLKGFLNHKGIVPIVHIKSLVEYKSLGQFLR